MPDLSIKVLIVKNLFTFDYVGDINILGGVGAEW